MLYGLIMSFAPFERLAIDGVGLMGGSLGLAVRERGMAKTVVGLGRSKERLEAARRRGAVDEIQTDAKAALDGADALIVALPPRRIRERWAQLARHVAPGAFVTDLGSVKAGIVAAAQRALRPGVLFVGSHPMAGSEKTGVAHARADLYDGATCILTPTRSTDEAALARAFAFWRALGSRIVIMTPERHDALLAGVSHLPHLAAAALMQALGRRAIAPRELAALAGPGLRDATRIAGSDPAIWREILGENARQVRGALDELTAILAEWREALDAADPARLEALYGEGRRERRMLERPADDRGVSEP
jgi:prephenate dehydrogenase